MLNELDIYAPDFSGTFITEQGNQYECFNLPKRECLILVSGYNLKLRTKIIDRWQELEQATTPRLPPPFTGISYGRTNQHHPAQSTHHVQP